MLSFNETCEAVSKHSAEQLPGLLLLVLTRCVQLNVFQVDKLGDVAATAERILRRKTELAAEPYESRRK